MAGLAFAPYNNTCVLVNVYLFVSRWSGIDDMWGKLMRNYKSVDLLVTSRVKNRQLLALKLVWFGLKNIAKIHLKVEMLAGVLAD